MTSSAPARPRASLTLQAVVLVAVLALVLPTLFAAMVVGFELALGERPNVLRRGFLDTLPEEDREPMWEEFIAVSNGDNSRYRTNAHWIWGPFEGEYYNVDADGVRRTVQATPSGPRVFMFGGSSLWGFHARDAHTIPSLVSEELARLGVDAEIVNHAQIGYVSTQEVIYLSQLVAGGDIPAVAVFLDGLNDIDAPKLLSSVGWHTPAEVTGIHFADSDFYEERQHRRSVWKGLAASLRELRVIQSLVTIGLFPSGPRPGGGWRPGEDDERMASLIAEGYANNVAMAAGLGRSRGFETLFYWQPTVATKKTLTDHESPPRFIGADDGRHFIAVTQAVRRTLADEPRFRDISGLLDDLTETGYTDSRHYTVLGKRMVAARIAADLAPLLRPSEP